jgi:hypothetical protein
MAKVTYDQKLKRINDWVEITNYHWDRLKGELYNDEEFWEHIFGSMTADDWWFWVDIAPAVKIQYETEWRRWYKLDESTEDIKKKLMLGKPLYRKDQKNANIPVFRAWMNIKDFINDINGTPTKQYTVEDRKPQQEPTPKERLFIFDYDE